MKTYLWIAIFSSIAMLFSGISVLLNNDPFSVIGFGLFSVAAGLNWDLYHGVHRWPQYTRHRHKEKRRKQYEKLKEEFDERD